MSRPDASADSTCPALPVAPASSLWSCEHRQDACATRGEKTPPIPVRRGVTVLIVLLLLSITLGLSYAIVRSQTTALQVQQNANVRVSARRAALTGLTVALKEMHTTEWCYGDGVNTTLSGPIGDHERYRVTYAAGDPSLAEDDPDCPYRVTLLSTGTATDPSDPERTSTHQARAVVRLVPRKLADEPHDWDTMQQYTVYQSKKDSFEVDIPCRFEGRVRVQGQLKIGANYPPFDSDAWWGYLLGLKDMLHNNPDDDYRPFTDSVYLDEDEQNRKYVDVLRDMDVTVNHEGVDEAAHVGSNPPSQSTYQIYPGGPVYTIPTLDWKVINTTLEPDPTTNPLGIYQRNGTLRIDENVTVRGSVFCTDDIRVRQGNVHFEPIELPGLHGSDGPVRLPVAYCKNFIVTYFGQADLTGFLGVFDQFLIEKSPDTRQFAVTGRLVMSKLLVKERQPWKGVAWDHRYEDFEDELEEGGTPYFPVWMADWDRGYDPKPLITFKADPNPVTYHWKNPNDPIYVPHPNDDGLRWDLLEWTDSL